MQIEYLGETFAVGRYYKLKGELVFVCETDRLYGPERNQVLAKWVDAVRFSDRGTLIPGPGGVEQ